VSDLDPTPSQTVGPFFSIGLSDRRLDRIVSVGTEGAVRLEGRVLDGAGEPVADAMVEVWQADAAGEYGTDFGWGRSGTDDDGHFEFLTVKPGSVAGQAPHLLVLVFARGLLKPVLTRMYFPDEEETNSRDEVLATVPSAERATLVAAADGDGLRFDVRLQGDDQTAFFDL
jgi:protocatechuate 3,4-dioxygenase alpha subunit